jgi:hypothetical protein
LRVNLTLIPTEDLHPSPALDEEVRGIIDGFDL